ATNDNCVNSLAQTVDIFHYITVEPLATKAYFQNFGSSTSGWIPESLSLKERGDTNKNDSIRYSWIRGVPNGVNIKPQNGASDSAWWTGRRIKTDPYPATDPGNQ